MQKTSSTIKQRILQILVGFGIVGMSFIGIQLLAASPCDISKTWSVGRVDPQFGLSKQMVAQYGKESTDIWNSAYAKNPLFLYRQTGGEITLNFVYDERMQTTLRNQRLKRNIIQGKTELSNVKDTLASLKEEYAALQKSVDSLTFEYQSRLNLYNREVKKWNSEGGAPKDVYAQLEDEKQQLEKDRMSINSKIQYYNQLGEKIKEYGENHNEIVYSLNQQIETLNESSGQEFEEGVYDPNTNSITIYEYASPTALKRVLTHEFGHSLGIGHVGGTNSIMYAINQGVSLSLSDEDLAALQTACQEKKLDGFLQLSAEAFSFIRGGISRLVGLSSIDTAAQLE